MKLALGGADRVPVPLQDDAPIRADALERAHKLRLRPDLHKARPQRRAVVAQHFQQHIARLRSAELPPGAAARRNDQPVAVIALPGHGPRLIAARLLFDLADLAAAHDRHARRVQRKAQDIHDAVRLIGEGIDPSARLRDRYKAEPPEFRQRRFHAPCPERRQGKFRLLAVIVLRPQLPVGQIAASVSRRQQLPPDARLPLQQRDAVRRITRRRERRRHSTGAAADNQHLHSAASLPVFV